MRFIALVFLLGFFAGCKSAPPKAVQQQILSSDRETTFATNLTAALRKKYGSWSDAKVQAEVDRIVLAVLKADPDYASACTGTKTVLLATDQQILLTAGPAKTIYVSRAALRSVRFENELVFLMASALSLIRAGAPHDRLEDFYGQEIGRDVISLPTAPRPTLDNLSMQDWFSPGGLFDYGLAAYLNADRSAINVEYKAYYDARGASTLLERWNSEESAPLFEDTRKILPDLKERLDQSRIEVAKQTPVRDPIINSQMFSDFRNRLRTKKSKTETE